jgi:hypothetical protein
MHLTYTIRCLNEVGGEKHSHTLNCAALNDAVAIAITEKIECARIEISLRDTVVWSTVPRSFWSETKSHVGVGPTVSVVNQGVAKQLSTSTLKDDAYAFIFDHQAGLSLEGTKISRTRH